MKNWMDELELNDRVVVTEGYRAGEVGVITWIDNENNVCKVKFDDDEFHGYDTSDVKNVE